MELLEFLPTKSPLPIHPDLAQKHLETLYHVSRILAQSHNPRATLQGVVEALHDHADMQRGVVTLVDPHNGELFVHAAQGGGPTTEAIRYRPGEGMLGVILAAERIVVVNHVAEEPRFLNRLGLLDVDLPFVGVPIRIADGTLAGVLMAQPDHTPEKLLPFQARFLEMVAQLMVQSILLGRRVSRERETLEAQRDNLLLEVRNRYALDNIVGDSPAMRRVYDLVRMVSKWDTTVLIRGESGTGKELVANAIHYNSPRSRGSFIKLNCAALPDTLLESELFGHEKGAFTGALHARKGRFELAHGGTLFLDELGAISPSFQAKLLRVLQEGEFERVGGETPIRVDVRIVAATNRHLEKAVVEGEFREDLYCRLNVMVVELPPLRERREDLPALAGFLVDKMAKRQGRNLRISEEAVRLLMQHHWPGNVRELENSLERAAVMCEREVIEARHILLPREVSLSRLVPPPIPPTRRSGPPPRKANAPPNGSALFSPCARRVGSRPRRRGSWGSPPVRWPIASRSSTSPQSSFERVVFTTIPAFLSASLRRYF